MAKARFLQAGARVGAVAALVCAAFSVAQAEPDNDTLVVEGETIATETAAPDGSPFSTLYSGWRFRSDCAEMSLEKSVHIPDGVRTRAAEQIVLKLTEGVQTQRQSVKWAFKRMSRGMGTG